MDQAATGNGWTLWKAIDETLARPVSVLTFAPGFPRISQVVTAARAASRLTDPRMAQVYDVEDGGDQAYIVLEWADGEPLPDLLDNGPLDPAQACSMVIDAARAIAGAHSLGQAHLRLTPETLRWSRGSGIKVTGLGIDAALAGDGLTGGAVQDPLLADTTALAALLYAALTGYWPGEEPSRLPAAPVSDGVACAPRQVSADVPSALDSVIVRALLQHPTRQGQPIQSPAEFASELEAVAPPVPLPELPPLSAAVYGYTGDYGPDPDNPDTWHVNGRGPSGTAPYEPPPPAGSSTARRPGLADRRGRRRGRLGRLTTVVVAALVIVVGVVAWAVGFNKSEPPAASAGRVTPGSASAASAAATVLAPVGVVTFNPYGHPPGNTENEISVQGAIDNNPSTAWSTAYYYNRPNFGGLKPGTGLLIDMGKEVKLSQVEVLFSSTGGPTTAAVYLGNNPTDTTATGLSNFKLVSSSVAASGDHKFPVSSQATGRYVLIWLTRLPELTSIPPGAQPGNTYYEGKIFNVVVRGSVVSGSS